MQPLFIYILKVILISGLLLLYYYIGLRNKRFHFYNRFYLLFTVILSLILPVLHLQWFSFSQTSGGAIRMYNIIYSGNIEDFNVKGHAFFNWQLYSLLLFIVTSAFMLTQLILNITKIYRLKKLYPVRRLTDFDFIQTDLQSAPFSFFKNIFWRNDIEPGTPSGKQILQHEITHIKQNHSLDKIFMQLALCFCWMNPFFWWLKKELYLIHEFIADEKAVNNNDASSFAEMLLTFKYGKFEFLPAQSIFYSPIKRRLLMLTTSKKTQFSYLRRIMVLPLIAAVICMFAFTFKNESSVHSKTITAAIPFKLVVDAGHGGKDDGAAANGLYEKDLNLKIAEAIKKLSPEFGIDVILTRDNDVYMSPPEKINFANAQNANAFISIHVNNADENTQSNSGMEVILSEKNPGILENSKVLGSAIIQNLKTDFTIVPALLQMQTGIWVLQQSKAPCVLIECGYINNANDVKYLNDDAKIGLMARNILQGVAMYANNTFDKSNLYQLKNRDRNDTSIPAQSNSMRQTQPTPLYVLDGKVISKSAFEKISREPESIMSVDVLKDQNAINKYGDKGKNGVIEITLKKDINTEAKSGIASVDDAKDTSTKPIFTNADKEPEFPGGIEGWRKYLENNVNANVPAKQHAPKGIYTVTLSFLVDENGKVSEVKAIKDPGYGTAEEAERVIAKGPNWIPATQNGRNVIYRQRQNITFQVTQQ